MITIGKIITVGLTPAWDRSCYVDGIDWGEHKPIASQSWVPAGKALNISKTLAWLSVPSTAAGLWGKNDYAEMTDALTEFQDMLEPAFTVVDGTTRQNITIIDTRQKREMHLRTPQTLITPQALEHLYQQLQQHIDPHSRVIFAGSIPQDTDQDGCIQLITSISSLGAELIVDTSGSALKRIVNQGRLGIIKPNLSELSELLGTSMDTNIATVVSSARKLCDRAKVVIVSLGANGAVAVTHTSACYARVKQQHHPVIHTVGCGDCLLAGFVAVKPTENLQQKLTQAVQVATAKAWGWIGTRPWQDVKKTIEIDIIEL